MNRYTIYSTEEQTRKALKLGAPIISYHNAFTTNDIPHYTIEEGNGNCTLYIIPTAEQMTGWLRSKGFRFKIVEHESYVYWQYSIDDYFDHNNKPSAKEATLAAIDAALDYLEKR